MLGEEEPPRFFFWIPALLGLGIGLYFAWPSEPSFQIALAVTLLMVIGLLYFHEKLFIRIVFFLSLGFTLACASSSFYGTPMLNHAEGPLTVEGALLDVEQHGTGQRLLLGDLDIPHLAPEQTPKRIHLTLSERTAEHQDAGALVPGKHVHAVAQLLPLSEPFVPDGFDFRRNAFFQGIGGTGYILGKLSLSAPEAAHNGSEWFAQLRQNLQTEIKKTLSGDRAGLAIILLTGDKTALSAEITTAMRAVGLAHLLAIAGLHVGLVAGIIFYLVRLFLACFETLALHYPIKKWAALVALAAIAFYTMQVGAPVPTRRSLLMVSVALIGMMTDRISFSLRTVALAAFIILLLWPAMLLSPSFQLSFAAVGALIAVGEWQRKKGWVPFRYRHDFIGSVLRHVAELAIMSFVATLATLPFTLYHFQEAGIYSMLANTLAIPLTSLWLMPLCVLVDLLWPLGLAEWPLRLLDPGLGLLINISKSIADLPGASYTPPAMPIALLIVATLGLLMTCLMTTKLRYAGFGLMLLAIVLTFAQPHPAVLISPDGRAAGWRENAEPALHITSIGKHDVFLADYWAHFAGVDKTNVTFDKESEHLHCDEKSCVWNGFAKPVIWYKTMSAIDACKADFELIIVPQNDFSCANSPATIIDRAALEQHGAYAVYAEGKGLRLYHHRAAPARRPWQKGWQP